MINGIKIINIEGSEILKGMNGEKVDKEYKAVFSNSLLSNKLQDMKMKVEKGTTKDVVGVEFNYGYTPLEAREIEDIINTLKEELKALKGLKIDKKDEESKKIKKINIDAKVKKIKELEQKVKELKINKEKVRELLYTDGFTLDFYKKNKESKEYVKETIEYIYFFRTPSKSRCGEVIFINKKLALRKKRGEEYNKIREWQQMGLELPSVDAKKVEMEAYLSLTSSTIESTITLDPFKEILVVSDLKTYVKKECAVVTVVDEECVVKQEIRDIESVLFDGQALMDGDFVGMKLLRNHFFKSCAFSSLISLFFQDYCRENGLDYNTYQVKDRYGRLLNVKDIKLITTQNSMKWEKFLKADAKSYEYWCKRVQEDNNIFGVCKTDHSSKYGEHQRMSYQMVNSLPINQDEAIDLCKDTVDIVNSLKEDNEKFIEYLERTKSALNENEMIIALYKHNKEFQNSEFFRKYKTKELSEYKERLRAGKLLVGGDNLTIVGNPFLMLQSCVGQVKHNNFVIDSKFEDETLPLLKEGYSVYTTRFDDEEKLCMFRNPHNAPNNILYGVNNKNELMDKYFRFSDNILAVNMCNTDVQARANGADQDSDFVFVTNNKTCVNSAKKALEFKTIVNDIPETGKRYNNTMQDLANIDNCLAKGKYSIGLSSNLAQKALSWMWMYQDKDIKKYNELKDIVCIASVLAQISIDSSKREYSVNLENEIKRIEKLPCMDVKVKVKRFNKKGDSVVKELKAFPLFWKYTSETKLDLKENKKDTIEIKNKKLEEAKKVKKQKKDKKIEKCLDFNVCAMDFIQVGLDAIKNNYGNERYTEDITFVKENVEEDKGNTKQKNAITKMIEDYDNFVKKHHDTKEGKDESWEVENLIKFDWTVEKISSYKITQKTMQRLILSAFSQNKHLKRKILNCLFKAKPKLFLSCFKVENV
jgi:hypothetical protein